MILDFNIVYSLLSKFERAGQEETPSTPIRLVREMLDKLPPEIWSDPSKTFLDPACSTGTFLLEIVRKLNIGLASQIPDQTERLKHILTKQVWGLELSRVPFFMTKAAFEKLFIDTTGIVGEVNIYPANALDGAKEIKDMKFDVVVGNPPYNPENNNDGGSGSGHKIWHKFIEKSFSSMSEGSYLCFITPPGWRIGDYNSKRKTKMAQEVMFESLEMLYWRECKEDFGSSVGKSITMDLWIGYYPLSGEKVAQKIPQVLIDRRLLPKTSDANAIKKMEKWASLQESTECYRATIKPHVKKDTKDMANGYCHINTSAQRRGGDYKWYAEKTEGFDDRKVIISDSGMPDPFYDKFGEFGTGKHSFGYLVTSDEEAQDIKDFYNSPLCEWLFAQFTPSGSIAPPIQVVKNIPRSWREIEV